MAKTSKSYSMIHTNENIVGFIQNIETWLNYGQDQGIRFNVLCPSLSNFFAKTQPFLSNLDMILHVTSDRTSRRLYR